MRSKSFFYTLIRFDIYLNSIHMIAYRGAFVKAFQGKLQNFLPLPGQALCAGDLSRIAFQVVGCLQVKGQAAQGRARDWAESLSGTEDTELLLIRREQAELLRECLKTLPQREIDLLNYAYTLELSSKEITRLTGLAPGNVRQILTRARRKVIAAYIEKGGMNHE